MAAKFKVPVHVEVQIKSSCILSRSEIVNLVVERLKQKCPVFQNGVVHFDDLAEYIELVTICDLGEGKRVSFWQSELCIHAFRLSDQGPESDFLDGEEELSAAEQWELPNALLTGLWDSIVVDPVIKNRLLSYCSSSIQFSDARIDSNIISWNRMVLLHGPPGTGKTTICKALAQKMFIRNSDRYSSGILLEVNSHSLFSKWFSESGKLVMKLFAHIGEIADDEECLVLVLIDEIESITSARSSASRSNEPGDAVRVVNAVLTSLDQLKRRPNVLLLSTSNMVDTVDPAFLDRVDLKVYLGPPSVSARYNILRSCLTELMDKRIIQPTVALSDDTNAIAAALLQKTNGVDVRTYLHSTTLVMAQQMNGLDLMDTTTSASKTNVSANNGNNGNNSSSNSNSHSSSTAGGTVEDIISRMEMYFNAYGELPAAQYLYIIAYLTEGMSGRGLRKLPIKAHSFYLQRPVVSVTEFLCAIHATIDSERGVSNNSGGVDGVSDL